MNSFGANGLGHKTATAGTAIVHTVPAPGPGHTAQVKSFSYTDAATVHNIYAMREIGRTKLAEGYAAGSTTLTTLTDPGPTGNLLAANDWVTIRCDNGINWSSKATSFTAASKTLIIPDALPYAASAGNTVWNHGAPADTDPNTGLAHPLFKSTGNASVPLNLPRVAEVGALVSAILDDSPILVLSDNATTAGKFNDLQYQASKPS